MLRPVAGTVVSGSVAGVLSVTVTVNVAPVFVAKSKFERSSLRVTSASS